MLNHHTSVSGNENVIAIGRDTIATATRTPWEAVAAAPTAATRKTSNTRASVPATVIQPGHAVTIESKTNGTIAMIELEIETATATETGTEIETATRETPATRTETETTVAKENENENEIETETGCEIPACIGMCLGCRTVCLAGNILSLKLYVVGFHLLRFWLQQESEC